MICPLQTRFATDERVYKAFLEILNMYRKGQKNITHVYEEVSLLLTCYLVPQVVMLVLFTLCRPAGSHPLQVTHRSSPGVHLLPARLLQQPSQLCEACLLRFSKWA